MPETIKMTKEMVDENLKKVNTLIEVAQHDIKSFEEVNKLVLTDENCAASKVLKKFSDNNDEQTKYRKGVITECIDCLKTAKKELQNYVDEMELN